MIICFVFFKGPAERDAFKFHEEERLPANFRATLADYGTTDFCRGHRFPAAEAKHSKVGVVKIVLPSCAPSNFFFLLDW